MAVGLDSTNSLLRSYLGKAYFEEKRDPLDARQFAIAKALDPLDPTPYLYDAIRLQSINQPVDAMLNMEKSIELNDNRAIYRSRQLLDSDRATRGANLAQIYDDLGFRQLAVNQGYDSLMLDPGNTSAHRFLADTFAGEQRVEIARVSELLQAQMLQDININPVQPSLAETNLSLITRGGPFKPGFNEYTPLFERNDIQLVGSALGGRGDMLNVESTTPTPADFNRNDDTSGFEGIASALYNRFSISAGGFDYDTDGWRTNAGFEHKIQNFFAQAAVTPDLNIQIELRHRESQQGDLDFSFDPTVFNPDFQRSVDHDIARAGLRYSPSPNSDVLLSYIFSDLKQQVVTDPSFKAFGDDKSSQGESQYIYRGDWLNLIAGFLDTDVARTSGTSGVAPVPEELTHLHPYLYTNVKFPKPVTWTIGVSYDDFEQDPIVVKHLNPKFGVSWDITDDLTIRAAAFKWVKPPLNADRTLEPTQVSGFNQFFDEANGETSWRQGVALDWRLTRQLFAGAEATWREPEVPILDFQGQPVFETQKEQSHRAYIFWAPTSRLSLSGQVVYDTFSSETGLLTNFSTTPKSLKTFSFPLAMRYFDPNGFFAGVVVTGVDQDVFRTCSHSCFTPSGALLTGPPATRSDFLIVDASVGWRFPKRLGIATLTAKNLFDEKFFYQDDSFREFRDEPSTGPFVPGRQVVGRVTMYF
jgi:hypothetical protein